MDERSLAWLQIGRAAVAESVKRTVLKFFPDPVDALKADLSAWRQRKQCIYGCQVLDSFVNRVGLQQDIDWLSTPGRYVVGLTDPIFPELLREIANPPAILYCEGEASLLLGPSVAVVGSRNPTPVGSENAFRFASTIGDHETTVVSGLALGIDSAAHRGALHTRGSTIAVCATGLDMVYPRCHQKLACEIVDVGLMLSEFPPGVGVRRHHFPQ
ncbi:MAG TPA: DNA-protecting protein DprA, partial [Gammaproteobacteria bacterium]|nr:DNA-protecting protein DprA [Gammaproteobacteria bacterium]